MLRTLVYLAILAVISAIAVWVVDHPGTVNLRWGDYLIESSLAMLALGVVALAASWAPAWRASRVEPVEVLRAE